MNDTFINKILITKIKESEEKNNIINQNSTNTNDKSLLLNFGWTNKGRILKRLRLNRRTTALIRISLAKIDARY